MINLLKFFLLTFTTVSIVGCTSTKKIQSNLNSKSYSLAYLMDSEIKEEKVDVNIKIDTIYYNAHTFPENTEVMRTKALFLPLVFAYLWSSTNNCVQGKSMIEEEIPIFFKESLEKECNRSGIFKIDSEDLHEYSLELSIDEIKTEGPYMSKGFFIYAFLMYFYSNHDYVDPAQSQLKVNYNLKRDGKVIHHNTFYQETLSDPIPLKYKKKSDLQNYYAISMVEANSYNIKNVIELVVNDVNSYIENNKIKNI